MARQKRSPREKAVNPEEPRWRHHRLLAADIPGVGRRLWNSTATALDTYHYGGFITPGQHAAGDRLRRLWRQAGREPRVVSSLERVDGGGAHEMTDDEAGAWHRLNDALSGLAPVHRGAVYDVCCLGMGAEAWAASKGLPSWVGLLMLRDALEGLVRRRPTRRRRTRKLPPA